MLHSLLEQWEEQPEILDQLVSHTYRARLLPMAKRLIGYRGSHEFIEPQDLISAAWQRLGHYQNRHCPEPEAFFNLFWTTMEHARIDLLRYYRAKCRGGEAQIMSIQKLLHGEDKR